MEEKEDSEIKLKVPEFVKQNWYVLLCFAVFGVLFFIYMGNLFDHSLEHSYPFPYFAADQFSQLATAEAVINQGHYQYMPGYANFGNENTLPHYGPGMTHLAVLGILITGLNSFNAIVLIFGILFLIMGFIFFESLNVSQEIKILSLSFMPLLIVFNFVIAHLWGQYGSLIGTFFLFLLFFVLNNEQFRKPLYIGLTLSLITISHFSDLVFAILYIALFLVYHFIKEKDYLLIKKINLFELFEKYKIYLYSILIFLLLTAFYLVIFYYGNYISMIDDIRNLPFITKPSEFDGFRVPLFSSFGFLSLFIVLGILVLIFYKNESKITLYFILFITFINYYSFFPQAAFRAFQQRLYWPIVLAPFFAFFVYFLLNNIKELKKNIKTITIILFLVVFSLNLSQYKEIRGPGVISDNEFEAMKYMETHIDNNDKIGILYGDGYNPALLDFKKLYYPVPSDYMIESIKNQKINQIATFEVHPPCIACMLAVFKDGKITSIPKKSSVNYTICDFDFYVLDKSTIYNNQMILFNKLFIENINKSKFEIFYENNQVIILKKIGDGPCLIN